MKRSITIDNSITIKPTAKKSKMGGVQIWAILFWLLIWELASLWIGQEILLVSPVTVVVRLSQLVFEKAFWSSILFSFVRIIAGFLIAVIAGVLFAGLSARYDRIRELITPAILTIKAIPVASFIILVLIWVPSRNLSVFITFTMVMPIFYLNVLNGINSTDPKLLEMCKLFRISAIKKIRYIYVSEVLPLFRSACNIGLGLCWKAGIAAEVIGIPDGSIGERLYEAKIYLNTPDLFAWTVVIVVISLLFEKIFLHLIDAIVHFIERI